MRGEHGARAIGAVVVLLILLVLFWNKIKTLLIPAGAVSSTIAGTPVPDSAQTLTAAGAAAFTPQASNATALAGVTGLGAPSVPTPTASPFPFAYDPQITQENSGLSVNDTAEISNQMYHLA